MNRVSKSGSKRPSGCSAPSKYRSRRIHVISRFRRMLPPQPCAAGSGEGPGKLALFATPPRRSECCSRRNDAVMHAEHPVQRERSIDIAQRRFDMPL